MKKYFSILLTLLCICTFVIPCTVVWAEEPDATIIFSDSAVDVGEEITVTLRFKSDAADISVVDGYLTYDSSIIECTSSSGGDGNLHILENAIPSVDSLDVTLTFRAIKTGSTTLAVNCDVRDEADVSLGSARASATLPVYNPTVALSSNANLASLSISYGTLTPEFSADITSYTVTVENSVTKFPLSAKAEDPNATLAIAGSQVLEVGRNQRTVTVTAQDGTQKTYTVTIVREEPENTASPDVTDTPGITNTPAAPTESPSQTQIPWGSQTPTQDTTPEVAPSTTPEVTVAPTQTVAPTATQNSQMTVNDLKNTVLIVLVILSIIIIVILFTVVYCMQQNDKKKRSGKGGSSNRGRSSKKGNRR